MRRSSSDLALRLTCSAILGAALCLAGVAHADDSEAAIKRGIELRRARKDAEALEQFRLAQSLRPSARALAQAGLAEQALSRWVQAERDLSQALAASDDRWVAEHRDVLTEALAVVRQHLGTLDLSASEQHAELWIGGARAGSLPLALRVPAGHIEAELRAPGRVPILRVFDVSGGQTLRERVVFEPEPAPAAQSASPLVSSSSPPPARALQTIRTTPNTWGWVTLGGAVAFVAGGAAAHVVRENTSAEYNDDRRCFYGGLSRAERCGDDLSRARTSGALAVVSYSTGAVLAGLSAYLWLRSPAAGAPSALGFNAGPGQASLRYEARFRSW